MTHTEESLLALAHDYHYANINNRGQREQALRLAIREVLAELDALKHDIDRFLAFESSVQQRAEKAEAERDEMRKDVERWRKASTSRNYGITDYTQFGVRTIHGTLAEEVIDAAIKDQP